VTRVFIDTGPIVAFLNGRDRFHPWAREVVATLDPPVFSCEPVLSEACFLVRNLAGGPDAVLELVARGLLDVSFSVSSELHDIRRLMKKFARVPMSLADACLVRMTELERDCTVITLDGDFRIYRRNRRQLVPVVMPS
jgi:predicted nucleic acid-binding protein